MGAIARLRYTGVAVPHDTEVSSSVPTGPHGRGTLRHVLPAVDGDVRTIHERGFLRAQIDDQARDVLGLAQPPKRYLRKDFRVEYLLWNRRHHLGSYVARRNGVDRHAL